MVNDPRVTQQLSRLGGVYRDPSRIDRDASSLCRSSVGAHLTPIRAEFFEEPDVPHVLVLQGTIAIHFRGQTYQILVDIYIPPKYPIRPPVCWVRLADGMYLKENHRHVGSDGKVYLPYLHEWSPHTHNLIELVVAMSSVFSDSPPVYAKPPDAAAAAASSTSTASSQNGHHVRVAQPSVNHHQQQQHEYEEMQRQARAREEQLAREVAEANAAAEAARIAERMEQEQQAKQSLERAQLQQIKEQVNIKIHKHFQALQIQYKHQKEQDLKDEQRLAHTKHKISAQMDQLEKVLPELERKLAVAKETKAEMQEWIHQAKELKDKANDVSVDEKVQPSSHIHKQLLDLSAENATIQDALYFLDRGLYRGHLTCEQHLKQVRKLAKRQFLVRAHLIKINQVLLTRNQAR